MHQIAKLHNFRHFEIPRDLIFDCDEWTIENNLLTPSGKVSRFNIYKKHEKSIEECYSAHSNDPVVALFTDDDVEKNFITLCKNILETTDDLDINKSFTELGGSSMVSFKQVLFVIEIQYLWLTHRKLSSYCLPFKDYLTSHKFQSIY